MHWQGPRQAEASLTSILIHISSIAKNCLLASENGGNLEILGVHAQPPDLGVNLCGFQYMS